MMLSSEPDATGTGAGGPRERKRRRGKRSDEATSATRVTSAEKIGFTAIAAPLIGYVVQDLKKPDSMVRSLVGGAIRKFLPEKSEQAKAIDIGDRVEVLESSDETQS
jgi:hypothetical protein